MSGVLRAGRPVLAATESTWLLTVKCSMSRCSCRGRHGSGSHHTLTIGDDPTKHSLSPRKRKSGVVAMQEI
ncbi:hypothetical protein BDZ85DRAFT_259930 [Elsinoe ampelina]|uniref:Uncharacterized protein n=1 Tax=Elsinoe ampelina TaxID=302913 RepID=A0A6A6GII7_9PEZI|nr:hypothetical protein BDZ85DRAFT_259930 [Elsinoe ampelina]